MVNTEPKLLSILVIYNYNILNIVVNTEHGEIVDGGMLNYNILNIVVNTERRDK